MVAMSKLKVTLFYILRVCFIVEAFPKVKYLCFLAFFGNLKHLNPFLEKPQEQPYLRYWLFNNQKDVISLADKLFEEGKYVEVYELLNRLKYQNNVEVKWRVARSIFFLLEQENFSDSVRRNMILEARDVLESSITTGEDNASVHKWMAIIMNEAKGLEGLEYRIKSYPIIKKHLLKSAQLNPNDFCVYYMLGKMTYELCNMSRFQRFIARHLYAEPSQASFREAYEYLQRAEELQPRCFVPNLFYLGSVCIKMKMYYRAQYYLTMAMNLGTNGKTEKRYAYKARQIIDRMEKYDLGKDVLYTSHLHGYGFTD